MEVRLLAPARMEFLEAQGFYRDRSFRLAEEFVSELAPSDRCSQHPRRGQPIQRRHAPYADAVVPVLVDLSSRIRSCPGDRCGAPAASPRLLARATVVRCGQLLWLVQSNSAGLPAAATAYNFALTLRVAFGAACPSGRATPAQIAAYGGSPRLRGAS